MELYLLRHGQSEANVGLTEHLDSPLTATGQAQAAQTAVRLATEGINQIYVSPLRRTLQTVAPTCNATGLKAEVYADVCEYFSWEEYKQFPGLSPAQISQEFPFAYFGNTFPCGESWWPKDLENPQVIYRRSERVRDALLGLYAATEERILIVSHAATVGRLIEAFLRVPPNPEDPPWSDNCGLSRLHCSADAQAPATLIYQNDTTHLHG